MSLTELHVSVSYVVACCRYYRCFAFIPISQMFIPWTYMKYNIINK